jgi:hypothetical protein
MRRTGMLLLLSASAFLLAGCGDAARPRNASVPASASAMEFRGERPCVDCDAIQAWLRLEHAGTAQRYRLIEHYQDGAGAHRFEDEGEWQAQGDLLRLRSATGGERVYARLSDGSLQARDSRGGPLPAAADDVMVPVAFDSAR